MLQHKCCTLFHFSYGCLFSGTLDRKEVVKLAKFCGYDDKEVESLFDMSDKVSSE